MYRKILLAYDGTVEGRLALREGARIAQICGADVVLLAVVDLSTGVAMEAATVPVLDSQREVYEQVLSEGARRLHALGFQATTRFEIGDPAQRIGAVAREIGADLVVVGHRRQGALARWLLGSVGKHLIDHLHCSLLVARTDISDEQFAELTSPASEGSATPRGPSRAG
jgi:nucleotide-binding universal stress UspA family protein